MSLQKCIDGSHVSIFVCVGACVVESIIFLHRVNCAEALFVVSSAEVAVSGC